MSGRPPIVLLGDSLTAGFGWQREFPDFNIRNLGLNGDTCAGVWGRLDEAVDPEPAGIFLQIGINDFLRGSPAGEILLGHTRLWTELKAKAPRAGLWVTSLTPYMEEVLPGLPPNLDLVVLNRLLAEKAAEFQIAFIDLFPLLADEDQQLRPEYTSDGLHLTDAAYRIWAGRLRPFFLNLNHAAPFPSPGKV